MKKNFLIFLLLCLTFGIVVADEIILKNGNRLYGKIIQETENEYALETGYGLIYLKKSKIKKVNVAVKSLLERYWEKLDQIEEGDLQSLWGLFLWCDNKGLDHQRDFVLNKIAIVDVNYRDVLEQLDYKQYKGTWLSNKEYQRVKMIEEEQQQNEISRQPKTQQVVVVESEVQEEELEPVVVVEVGSSNCETHHHRSSSRIIYDYQDYFPDFVSSYETNPNYSKHFDKYAKRSRKKRDKKVEKRGWIPKASIHSSIFRPKRKGNTYNSPILRTRTGNSSDSKKKSSKVKKILRLNPKTNFKTDSKSNFKSKSSEKKSLDSVDSSGKTSVLKEVKANK